jgi:YrbI family 3-deoxy-D-manno-octulosonate 8-phosphate phosphatase
LPLISPFIEFGFMRRALTGCLALSLGATPIGVFLMLRRMSLAGDAISHAILPGAAIGYLISGLSLSAMTLGGLVAGIAVALITARNSKAAERRGAELGVEVFTGAKDKLGQVRVLCQRQGIGLDEVAFMGDDLPDLAPLLAVGLSTAPGNAHRWIAERVHWVTSAHGGAGAARELCDLLLDAQDRTDALLAEWTR